MLAASVTSGATALVSTANPNPSPREIPLRQHLLRLTLGSLLPFVLFAAVVAAMLALREQSTFERGVRERTLAIMTAVDTEIESSERTLHALAALVSVEKVDLRQFHAEATRVLASQPHWLSISVALPTGEQVINALRPFGDPVGTIDERPSFERVIKSGSSSVGNLIVGQITREPYFPIRIPVKRGTGIGYVLSAQVRPDAIYRLLQAQRLPGDWVGAVVDGQRRFVARTLTNADHVGKPVSDDLRNAVAAAPQGWQAGLTLEGARVYTAHHTSNLSGWAVAIGVPAYEVEGAARQTVMFVAIGTGVACAIALLLAYMLGRRFSAPIGALAESARAIARGESAASPVDSGVAEVTALARAFDEAGAAVRHRIETQRQLSAVTGNATVALFMTDANKCCTFMNPAAERMTGRSLDEARGKPLHDVIHRSGYGELHRLADCPLHYALGGAAHRGTEVVLHMHGRQFDVEFAWSPLSTEGTPSGTVVEIRDITTEKRIEAERRRLLEAEQRARTEAESANQAKDEFLAMLGHELRNPLAAISNASQLLDVGNGQHAERAQAVIKRQTVHLARLVDDLLDAGRVATGKIVIAREALNLADVVQRTLATLAAAARTTHHAVTVDLEPCWVAGDETRLEQVAMNLLTNAVRYTPAGGSITVALHANDGEAVLAVADSGVGIAPAMLTRVFELFVQGDSGIERVRGGLGIGLTLVKRLVELHGGTVEAASAGRGHGSTFTVRLPRIDAPPERSPRSATAAGETKAARILLLEDNADAREMLRTSLEMAGHDVFECEDGTTGLAALRSLRPDVAIVDIGLPGLSGYEVARQARAGAADAALTLIALTGYGQPSDRERAIEAGFDAHVVKPVDLDDLLKTIESARQRVAG